MSRSGGGDGLRSLIMWQMLDLAGLPSRYSPTRPSLLAYVQDITDFLQSPLASIIISSHPNQIAISEQPFADSNISKEWLDWWEFFDVLGESEAPLDDELPSGNDMSSKPLRRLISTGELPVSFCINQSQGNNLNNHRRLAWSAPIHA